MKALTNFFRRERLIIDQQREIAELRSVREKLQQQNDSMREGMRRCTTCEYRIEIKQQQDAKREREGKL